MGRRQRRKELILLVGHRRLFSRSQGVVKEGPDGMHRHVLVDAIPKPARTHYTTAVKETESRACLPRTDTCCVYNRSRTGLQQPHCTPGCFQGTIPTRTKQSKGTLNHRARALGVDDRRRGAVVALFPLRVLPLHFGFFLSSVLIGAVIESFISSLSSFPHLSPTRTPLSQYLTVIVSINHHRLDLIAASTPALRRQSSLVTSRVYCTFSHTYIYIYYIYYMYVCRSGRYRVIFTSASAPSGC